MPDRALELQYKRQAIRASVDRDGVWISGDDAATALGYKSSKDPIARLPENEKSLRQIGGKGVRMRVLSPDGVLRLAGGARMGGADGFLKWFQEQAMPALGETALEQGHTGTELVIAEPVLTPVAQAVRTFLFETMPVRAQMDDKGEILFNANDVCEALELSNPRKALDDHVAPDDVTRSDTIDSMGRIQQANYVYLPGLYALVFGSKKEAARRFKRWVTHDVLPSIQKTGSYSLHDHTHAADETPALPDTSERAILQRAANLGSLMLSLPGADDATQQRQREDAQIQARQALVHIQEAAEGLKGLRLQVTFQGGLDRPQAQAMPGDHGDAPIQGAAADKAMAGRTYVLDFHRGVERPHIRPLRHDERIIKADREGVKFLANQARLGLEDWHDLENWAQRKVRAEENRRDR